MSREILNELPTQIGASVRDSYDGLGRDIAVRTDGFSGACTLQTTELDARGRVLKTSRPYFCSGPTYPSGAPIWTSYSSDDLGRVTNAAFPDGSHTASAYHGLETDVTNDKGQVKKTYLNAQGLVDHVVEPNGSTGTQTTSYVYDAFGDLLTVTDPAGNVITNTYDARGRKTGSHDPDMGSWSYVYDVADELISQTDAKSQTTTLAYDLLGRLTSRVDPSGFTSTWTWGISAANHNIGALASLTTSGSGSGSSRAQTYDSLGRPYQTSIVADTSNCTAAAPCVYTHWYDATTGRMNKLSYPDGYVVKYLYTSIGYLSQIADNGTGAVLWQADARDAELHLTQETLAGYDGAVVVNHAFDPGTGLQTATTAGSGNSIADLTYGWDTIGNLVARSDLNWSVHESFCYDTLNRLVHSKLDTSIDCGSSNPADFSTSVTYDAIGNITSKTQIGASISSTVNTYSYPASGSSSVRPHAVSSIAGSVNGISNPSFSYDLSGN